MNKLRQLAGGLFKKEKKEDIKKFDEDLDLDAIVKDGDRKPAFGCPGINYQDAGPKMDLMSLAKDALAFSIMDEIENHMNKCFTFGKPLIYDQLASTDKMDRV
jgi:hypothetical protein